MKKIIVSVMMFANIATINAQKSCCMKASTDAFAMMGNDKSFTASHEDPLPFTLTEAAGKNISFKTPDGKEGYGYEVNSDNKTGHVVFVIHEWWGLNDYIKQEAEKIAKETNAKVIAIDLYDQKVAAVKDSAAKFMQSVKKERAESIIKGAINYVGEEAGIATIGWCFGGGWSLQNALLAGKQAKACVMYYGMPEEDLNRLKTLNSPVLFIFAQKDQWINKNVLATFEENMKKAGKKLEVKSYNADHAFANPSNPHFNKVFSEEAFRLSMEHIKKGFAK
jgi:carboxymethylenebutenolidase